MDVFRDAELVFAETYSQKPVRTLKIPANAPVQATTIAVPASGGVATFPDCETYEDKFILWRAVGSKLFLEERSLCRTVLNGSLCLDFGRTTIVPGTSITIVKTVLIIVVPTQSAVHRFMAKLVPDIMDHMDIEVQSLFTQVTDRDFVGDNHSFTMLSTNSEVKKANVVTTLECTKVTYCMVDGQLTLVTMPVKHSEKAEEVVLREGGILSRITNSVGSNFVSDAAGLLNSKKKPVFYAIYNDATIRIWTGAENLARCSASAKLNLPGSNIEKCVLSIRVSSFTGKRLLSIAASQNGRTTFHNFWEQSNTFTYICSRHAEINGNVIDYQLVMHSKPGVKIYAVWDSSEHGAYQVGHTTITSKTGGVVQCHWTMAKPYVSPEYDYTRLKVQEIKEIILDTDIRPFEVVLRAVQIASGAQFDVAYNDWKSLQGQVEAYLRSPQLTEKYGDRTRTASKSSKINDLQFMQRKFYEALGVICEQLLDSDRGAIGLFVVDLEGASIQGAIQKDRFSVINSADPCLAVDASTETQLREAFASLPKEKKDDDSSVNSEDETEASDGIELTDAVAAQAVKLMQSFIELFNYGGVKPTAAVFHPFRGRFTSGLVGAVVKRTVKDYQAIVKALTRLCNQMKLAGSDFLPRHDKVIALSIVEERLAFLSAAFDIKMLMPNNMVNTLGSWFFHNVDFKNLRSEGSAPPVPSDKMNYNWFLDTSLEASLRALWPTLPNMLMPRVLAENSRYLTLMKYFGHRDWRLHNMKAAVSFYTGMAHSALSQPQKALTAFEEALDGIETKEEALHRALRPVGEAELVYSSLGELYTRAIRCLHDHNHDEEVVRMAKTAIESLPEADQNKNRIYATLFNQLVHQNKWAEALNTIKKNKDSKMRDMTLRDFMTRIIRASEWKMVTGLDFGELEENVENILLSAARQQEPTASPHIFEVLFSCYMNKLSLNKACQVMLEFGLHLQEVTQTAELLRRRRDVLATALTVMEQLPEEDRFTFFPSEVTEEEDSEEAIVPDGDEMETDMPTRSPRRMIKKRRMIIVDAKKVRREWALSKARLVILDNSILPPTDPAEIVKLLIESKHYDEALDMCREYDLEPSKVLFAVTTDTIMMDVQQPIEAPQWMQLNRRHIGRSFGDNWGIVRGLLATSRKIWPADSRPYRAVLTSILAHRVTVPFWLQSEYSEFDLPDYIRCLVDYDSIQMAIDGLANYIKRQTEIVTSAEVTTFLPYTVLDEVISIASEKEEYKKHLSPLNSQLRRYLDRVSSYETASRFSS